MNGFFFVTNCIIVHLITPGPSFVELALYFLAIFITCKFMRLDIAIKSFFANLAMHDNIMIDLFDGLRPLRKDCFLLGGT